MMLNIWWYYDLGWADMICMCCSSPGELHGVLKSRIVILTCPSWFNNFFQERSCTPANCACIWSGMIRTLIILLQVDSLKGNVQGWNFSPSICFRLLGQRISVIFAGSFSFYSCLSVRCKNLDSLLHLLGNLLSHDEPWKITSTCFHPLALPTRVLLYK